MTYSNSKVYPVLYSQVSYQGCGAINARSTIIRIGEGSTDRQLIQNRITEYNKTQYSCTERAHTVSIYGEDRTGSEIEEIVWRYKTGAALNKWIAR